MFIIGQFAEVQAIVETLQKGDWRFLFLALCVQGLWLVVVALTYRTIFQAIGLEETLDKLILLSAAAFFVNVIAPTAGVSGMAVFISQARQRGYSTGKVTAAGVLYLLFDYASFLCVLTLGLIVLIRRNNLNTPDIVASGILLAIASIMAFLMYLGTQSAIRLGNALAKIARLVNRVMKPFIHRDYLSEKRAHEYANEVGEALQEISKKPNNLISPALLLLTNKGLLISILLLTFLAFKVPFSIGTLVAGFSIGYLFLIVSPTPSGIGFVEGALTLALSSLYVPLGAAAVLTLAYRGITFWAPLLFGMLAVRLLSRSSEIKTII